jgi:hypothetical protein
MVIHIDKEIHHLKECERNDKLFENALRAFDRLCGGISAMDAALSLSLQKGDWLHACHHDISDLFASYLDGSAQDPLPQV